MKGLSQELVKQCHNVLSRCEEFNSQGTLQAVFVTGELARYQSRLPDAGSKADRISLTIDYLRLQYLSDGRSVLPLFLAELRDRRSAKDYLHKELEVLYSKTRRELSVVKSIEVPFVIAAMTQNEVRELIEIPEHFDIRDSEYAQIQQLKDQLLDHGIEEWQSYYGESREEWRPFAHFKDTIDEIIGDLVDHINRCEREPEALPVIRRRMLSKGFFATNSSTRTWDYLKQSGCLIIIDAISLFHPILREMLVQSGLTFDDKAGVIVLSPVDSENFTINGLILDLIKKQMMRTYSRYDELLDGQCEIGVGGLRGIQRWLFSTLPKTADTVNRQIVIDNRMIVRQKIISESQGIGQAVFGEVEE